MPLRNTHSLLSAVPSTGNPSQRIDLGPNQHPVIAGFRIGDPLGQSPFGRTYSAMHEQTGEYVIMRGFARPEDADPMEWQQAIEQFRNLLVAHQRIATLPNAPATIQKVLGFGEENGIFWIATEFLEGMSLRDLMTKEGTLPMTRIIEILRQVAEAVDWMGEQGLPHTDLTPSNLLLLSPRSPNGRPTLQIEIINFGLAQGKTKFGSPYAAPEQIIGMAGDRRSDVYAVGAILHEMLTGVPLFGGQTPEEVSLNIVYSPPRILVQRPQTAFKIVAAMTARQPEQRYQTVMEAITDLFNNREPRFAVPEPSLAPPLTIPPIGTAIPPVPGAAPTALGGLPAYIPAPPAPASHAPLPPYVPVVPPVLARPVRSEITLQNYRLSDQDLIILRWRREQEEQAKAEERALRRTRAFTWAKWGICAAIPCILGIWAFTWRDTYRYVTVQQVTGNVYRQEGSRNTLLHVGDQIRADQHPVIVTGATGNIVLSMPDSRLYLPSNSSLGLLRLDYKGGAVRHFELLQGGMVGMRDKDLKVKRYDVHCDNITTHVKGTHFFLKLFDKDLVVGTKAGPLVVDYTTMTQEVGSNTSIAFAPQAAVGTLVPMQTFAPLTDRAEQSLSAATPPIPPVVNGAIEAAAEPTLSLGDTLWKLPSVANDQRAIGLSIVGMQSLCTLLLSADSGEGLPESIDLKTLKELNMEDKDRQRILKLFQDEQLLSYRRLPNGGYEILARSLDSDHSLLRGYNGNVQVLSGDE